MVARYDVHVKMRHVLTGLDAVVLKHVRAARTERRRCCDSRGAVIWPLLRRSAITGPILDRWSEIDLPDAWLVAGAVTQTVWNEAHGFALEFGIRDVDIVYFDRDLSEASEQQHEQRVRAMFPDLPVAVDVKNEARVHLWYASKFGYDILPYASTEAALATFPTTAGAVGVRPAGEAFELCAPFGVDDLLKLIVRPNKAQITESIYAAKVQRWRALWPRLTIVGW